MSFSRLAREGWVAPEDPGPSRRAWTVASVVAVAAIAAWAAFVVSAASTAGGDRRDVVLQVDGDARRSEVRTSRGVAFLVQRETVAPGGKRLRVRVDRPAGVDPAAITLRAVGDGDRVRSGRTKEQEPFLDIDPHGSDRIRVLITVPVDGLGLSDARQKSAGSLAAVTGPFDEDRAREVDSQRLVQRLRDALVWAILLAPLLGAAVPLLLWRRATRRTFSMRLPGPGKEIGGEPPSSLDAVGVAVLAAGAGEVDAADAFAGHVLDLVERRQVRLRRTTAADDDRGVVLGLAHAEEGAIADDPAVAVLRSLADGDGTTVLIPEAAASRRRVGREARITWLAHVDSRERFERMTIDGSVRRIRLAVELLGTVATLAVIDALRTESEGRAALEWLVAAVTLPATIACIAWMRDARDWRVVARSRRVERAQWRAWRTQLGTAEGPALDQRSLPLLVAAGGRPELVRASADGKAVALDAVTQPTIDALRALVSRPD